VIIQKNECFIIRINFYSGKETLVKVGMDGECVLNIEKRVESFDIADDERLIGCIIHEDKDSFFFRGMTFMKMKVPKVKNEEMEKK
jgi:hypothetical protein